MSGTFLASIPSSRFKPRAATRVSATSEVLVKNMGTGVGPNGTTLVVAFDANQTDLTIRNLDGATSIFYNYDGAADILTEGMELKAGEALPFTEQGPIYMAGNGADVNVAIDRGVG